MSKLLFIYDKLMEKQEQDNLSLGLEFICFGYVKAKLRFFNDDKKKRLYIVPNTGKSTQVTYGAIFELENYDEQRYKLFSYYNSLIPFVGLPMKEDIFIPAEIDVIPIKFTSLRDIENSQYTKGEIVKTLTFIGNPQNELIQYNNKRPYYKVNSINSNSFVQCIKDNVKTTKDKR